MLKMSALPRPWRPAIFCMPLLMLLFIAVEIAIVQPASKGYPHVCASKVVSALIKLLALAAFHTAPALWLMALRQTPASHLVSDLQALRMPLSVWTATCLLIGWHVWPALNASPLCR
ncbi:hypothetical protein D9M68_560490 [compost metagenome]